jgi:hypothetical protein
MSNSHLIFSVSNGEIWPKSKANDPFYLRNGGFMGIFTKKEGILPCRALIGTDGYFDPVTDTHEVQWVEADFGYAMEQFKHGVLESRGYEVIRGVLYMKFYLPPPPHTRTVGP